MTAARNPDTLIRAFLEEGLVELPDRAFDAVRRDIHRTRQRAVIGQWREPSVSTITRLAIAAAVLVAVGIATLSIGRSPNVGDRPSPSPTASPKLVTGSNLELEPGRWYFDYGPATGSTNLSGAKVYITVPAVGWTNYANFAVDRNYGPTDADAGPSFVVWDITNVYRDPCTDLQPKTPAPGPGMEELLEALGSQAGLSAGPITDVTVDGFTGKVIDLTITADITECPQGFFPWLEKFVQGNNELLRVYALDVEGERLTFFLRIPARTTATDRAQLDDILESVDIEP